MMFANILTQAATSTSAMAQTVCRGFGIVLDRPLRTYLNTGVAADAAAAVQLCHPGHEGIIPIWQVFARRYFLLPFR